LEGLAASQGLAVDSIEFAGFLDSEDPLKSYRKKFSYPRKKTLGPTKDLPYEEYDEECVYLCGNSLGLKPKKADVYMSQQIKKWGEVGLYTHFTGDFAAAVADKPSKPMISKLVGAMDHEVSIMNSLSVNLVLMSLGFYKPTETRYKIIIEKGAFPSDRYAMESFISMNPTAASKGDGLIQLEPREGEHTLRTEDILQRIAREGESIALVMLPGIQYFTGQVFDMEAITKAGHEVGALVGWDLAHAVGNIRLRLHDWNVDFAVWCSYKYLNSGAGGVGGAFLHDRFAANPPSHALGWWANKGQTRFQMREEIDMAYGCDSFRLSNPSPFLMLMHHASLEVFDEAGMENIVEKQFLLTGYLEYLINLNFGAKSSEALRAEIITPSDYKQRGSQLSIKFSKSVQKIHDKITKLGVVCDLRGTVMRVAPAPLYNSYHDAWRFVEILKVISRQESANEAAAISANIKRTALNAVTAKINQKNKTGNGNGIAKSGSSSRRSSVDGSDHNSDSGDDVIEEESPNDVEVESYEQEDADTMLDNIRTTV